MSEGITKAGDFIHGLIDGLSISRYAFGVEDLHTKIDPDVLKPTYKGPEEDVKHIRGYWSKAISCAETEFASTNKNGS